MEVKKITVCEKIDNLIKEKGMSRRELALKAGISPSSFQTAMARNTHLSFDMLIPIAEVLETDLSYFLQDMKLGKFEKISIEDFVSMFGHIEFSNETDRIKYYYSRLDDERKFQSSWYFISNLNPEKLKEVADTLEKLYQKQREESRTPSEGK